MTTPSGKRLCISIPDTLLEEHDNIREKTVKLGQVARSCSIFGVDFIQIFRDPRGRGESSFMRKILEYLETPQYLRRRLFPLDPSLRFAGLLPPLRIPSHKPRVAPGALRPGEFREGVLLEDGMTVDVGLEQPLPLKHKAGGGRGARVTVRVTSAAPRVEGVVVDRSEVGTYWGYVVEANRNLDDVLSDARFNLRVATSRLGSPLVKEFDGLREGLSRSRGAMLIFGSPSRGLFQMTGDLPRKVQYVINLFSEQWVATVRTEEAVFAGLYLVQLLSAPYGAKQSLKAESKSG